MEGQFMPKNKKNLSKRNFKRTNNKNKTIFFVIGSAIIILLASLVGLQNKPTSYIAEVEGAPSLQVDEDKVDLGDIRLGTPMQTSFKIKNVGDQVLKFTQIPYVEVKEGC